jgi:hypothetical protein
MSLIQLIYLSSATQPFSPADLLALLETSRRNNTAADITGMLLYRDGNFIQVLEGKAPAVTATHERIAQDTRHDGLITLLKAPIAQRSFGDWSMGFRNLSAKAAPEVPGYNEFLNDDWLGRPMRTSPDRALKLLQLFRSGLR